MGELSLACSQTEDIHLGPADTTSPPEGTLDTSDQADFTLVNPKYIHIDAQTQTDTHWDHFLGRRH